MCPVRALFVFYLVTSRHFLVSYYPQAFIDKYAQAICVAFLSLAYAYVCTEIEEPS